MEDFSATLAVPVLGPRPHEHLKSPIGARRRKRAMEQEASLVHSNQNEGFIQQKLR